MKVVYTGIESSGKSLLLARKVTDLVKRNAKWAEVSEQKRPIYSNMVFSKSFEEYAKSLGVDLIYYKNLDEIIDKQECDVIIDEIIKYFDARNWLNLTIEAKHWLTQGAKMGVHVYGSAQDFSQVEKSFRLLCTEVYVVTKLIGSRRPMKSSPPVKRIWGLCYMRRVNPVSFRGDSVSMETIGFPEPFLIDRKDCEVFDTNAKVKNSELPVKRKKAQLVEYWDGEKLIKTEKTYT